jgi:hypothetical protein
MKTYKLECESRNVGAIGIMERHFELIEAESEHEAREKFRENFDYSKRDHLLIKNIYEIKDGE